MPSLRRSRCRGLVPLRGTRPPAPRSIAWSPTPSPRGDSHPDRLRAGEPEGRKRTGTPPARRFVRASARCGSSSGSVAFLGFIAPNRDCGKLLIGKSKRRDEPAPPMRNAGSSRAFAAGTTVDAGPSPSVPVGGSPGTISPVRADGAAGLGRSSTARSRSSRTFGGEDRVSRRRTGRHAGPGHAIRAARGAGPGQPRECAAPRRGRGERARPRPRRDRDLDDPDAARAPGALRARGWDRLAPHGPDHRLVAIITRVRATSAIPVPQAITL